MLSPSDARSRFRVAVTRWLWITLALTLVVSVSAVIVYARPSASWRHAYIATQALRIVATPGLASTTYDALVAHEETANIARAIAGGQLFSSPSFAEAVDQTLLAQHAVLVSRYGSDVPSRVSSSEIASALSASDTGDIVTLTCRGASAAGANTLLSGAVAVLAGTDDLRTLLPPSNASLTPYSALVQPTSAYVAAHLDDEVVAAARQELLTRIALGVLASLAVTILLAESELRRHAVRLPETETVSASTPDATPIGKRS